MRVASSHPIGTTAKSVGNRQPQPSPSEWRGGRSTRAEAAPLAARLPLHAVEGVGGRPSVLLDLAQVWRAMSASSRSSARSITAFDGPTLNRTYDRNRERDPLLLFPGFTSKNSPGTEMIFSTSAARKNDMPSLSGGGSPEIGRASCRER